MGIMFLEKLMHGDFVYCFLKSTGGHFSKVCSITISNPWVAITLRFKVSLTENN